METPEGKLCFHVSYKIALKTAKSLHSSLEGELMKQCLEIAAEQLVRSKNYYKVLCCAFGQILHLHSKWKELRI